MLKRIIFKPLFNLSPSSKSNSANVREDSKLEGFFLFVLVSLIYITACAEADIFVPAFPEMIRFFNIPDAQIQQVLSCNLFALCAASLIVGPLSDAIGRRPVLLVSLGFFALGSLGSVSTHHFKAFIFFRIIQGIFTAAPMVIGTTLIFDRFTVEKAGIYVGTLNSVITAAMAGAPILGAFLAYHFGWRFNFLTILVLSIVSFLLTLLFLKETLTQSNKKTLNLKQTLRDYFTLSSSFRYLAYSVLCLLPLICSVLYVGNLSVVLIKYMGRTMQELSFYQSSTMAVFVIFSFFSSHAIRNLGMKRTIFLGSSGALIGSLWLFGTVSLYPGNIPSVCVGMGLIAAGGAFIVGPYGALSMQVFPDLKGTAASLFNTLRQLSASLLIALGELFFNGSLLPVASLILGCALIGTCLTFLLRASKSPSTLATNEVFHIS